LNAVNVYLILDDLQANQLTKITDAHVPLVATWLTFDPVNVRLESRL